MEFPADRKLDLLCLGRAGVDLYPNRAGVSLLEAQGFEKYVGGSPANIAAALAKLGGRAGLITKLSGDQFGRYVKSYMDSIGVDTGGAVFDESGSRTSLALAERKPEDCDTLFYRNNPADLLLDPREIAEDYIAGARALLISGTALAESPSREAVFMALHYARKHGTVVFFDIDYRAYSWKSPEETSLYYSLAAEKCDVVIGTREEWDALEAAVLPGNRDDEATARNLFRGAAGLAVIKHGKAGSAAYERGGETFSGRIYPVELKKPYGAGDAFAGAFIYFYMKGRSVDECLNRGAAAASMVISGDSCSAASPDAASLEAFMQSYQE